MKAKISLLLFSLIISLFISELFLRLINYNYSPLRIQLLDRNDWRVYHAFIDRHFAYDPYLLWRPKSNYSVFNTQGYRGREIAIDKKPGEFRIFAFGDSNTLGWDAEDGPNWPGHLQDLLFTLDKNFTVINAGVWGYTSFQGLRRFKESIPFRPDMILVCFGSNDAHRVTISDAEYTEDKMRLLNLERPLNKFRIGQLIIALLDKFIVWEREDLRFRVSPEEYKDNLNEIVKLSQERNIKVILLTRPYIGESSDEMWWKTFAGIYRNNTIEVAKENAVGLINIYAQFKDKDEYFSDEGHFNETGHREAAKIIYENIKPLLLRYAGQS